MNIRDLEDAIYRARIAGADDDTPVMVKFFSQDGYSTEHVMEIGFDKEYSAGPVKSALILQGYYK